ncbi:hypothetical protein [Hymenobacter sp. APR13]|uniref:hypothetical protein n=1 Tax=Hymenobacter sp. APR13 TaxID=1356852 RepID=UPI0012E03910|nr:hypothetical protein [Hymenobacter sp. APR13]
MSDLYETINDAGIQVNYFDEAVQHLLKNAVAGKLSEADLLTELRSIERIGKVDKLTADDSSDSEVA